MYMVSYGMMMEKQEYSQVKKCSKS